MDYKTLLVHLELNDDNAGILKIAGDLAERYKARVIGVAACQPLQVLYDAGFAAGDVLAQDRAEISEELALCKARFHDALAGRTESLEWRCTITYDLLADYIAEQARAADLIVTGKDMGASLFDNSRRVNIGKLAMQAGRPLLIVPQGVAALPLQQVVVGWKDSPATRRAIADALPLLRLAGRVTLLEITSEAGRADANGRLQDVAGWLARHGVTADCAAVAGSGTEAGYFHAELLSRKCDLLVAGAFGHTRLGEWVFGGITQDVLLDPDGCVLISH